MTMQDLNPGNRTARWLSVLALVGTVTSLVSSNWSTVWGTLESWGVPEAAESTAVWFGENMWAMYVLSGVAGWYAFAFLVIWKWGPQAPTETMRDLWLLSPIWMPIVAIVDVWDRFKGKVSRAEVPRLVDNVKDMYDHAEKMADVPNVVRKVDQHLERLDRNVRNLNERANNILTNLAQLMTQVKDIRTPVTDSHSTVHLIQVRDRISQLMPLLDVIKGHLGRPIPVDWKGQDEFMRILDRIQNRPADPAVAQLSERVNALIEKVESGLDEGEEDKDDDSEDTVHDEFFDESWGDVKEHYEGKTPTWKMLEAVYWEGAYDGVNEKVSSKRLKEMYGKLEKLGREVEADEDEKENPPQPQPKPLNVLDEFEEWWSYFFDRWSDVVPDGDKVEAAFFDGLYQVGYKLNMRGLVTQEVLEKVAVKGREADKKLWREMLSTEDVRRAWETLKSSSPATKIAVNLTAMEEAFYSGVSTGLGNLLRPTARNEFEKHRQRLMAMRVGESEPVVTGSVGKATASTSV